MTETPLSKVSRMIQAGHMRVTRRLPRPVKRRLSWKTTRRESCQVAPTCSVGPTSAMTKELTALSPSTMKIKVIRRGLVRSLTRRRSDLEPRKQSACKMFLPRTMSTSSWSMAESSRIERRARRSNENACVTDVSDTCMPASCCQVDWRSASAR